jgi:hypothetical protein
MWNNESDQTYDLEFSRIYNLQVDSKKENKKKNKNKKRKEKREIQMNKEIKFT